MEKNRNFDRVRYIQLLKKQNLNKIERLELSSHQIILENQILYNHKNDYLCLIEEYLKNKITSTSLVFQFFQKQRKDQQIIDNLTNNLDQVEMLFINSNYSKLDAFSDLIENLIYCCDTLDDEPLTELRESEFRTYIENIFLQMKKILAK